MNISEACLKYACEIHHCPHCQQQLSCCAPPPFHVGDGLGWGAEAFFVCLNDDCPLYVNGWKHVEMQYGRFASYRYMQMADEKDGSPMMVGSNDAYKGCVIDPELIKSQSTRYTREKEDLAQLETCVTEGNSTPVLNLILDECAVIESRRRSCELLIALNDLACIDPIRNHKFVNTEIEQLANLALQELLRKNFRRECPFCSEIIKIQAKVCKHCSREL